MLPQAGHGEKEGVAAVIGLGPDFAVVVSGQLRGNGQPEPIARLGAGGSPSRRWLNLFIVIYII